MFQSRLFFRIISRNLEVYLLKIITLAIAFGCSTLIILFSLNEFGYDRFHQNAGLVFRVLQRNNDENFSGNRLSNKIPFEVFQSLQSHASDSVVVSRIKTLNKVGIVTDKQAIESQSVYAADPAIIKIFSFDVLHGFLEDFKNRNQTVLLSSSLANQCFGNSHAVGKKISMYTLGDTVLFTVAAVYEDFPKNSHEEFNVFIRYDTASIQSLMFNPREAGVYGRIIHGNITDFEANIDAPSPSKDLIYKLQPLPEIYFGPRVMGEESRHGDEYSIWILISITALILFLALTSFLNLTTLTLPYRSKELAVKKLAGTNQLDLVFSFAKESFFLVGISLVLGILLLIFSAAWIGPILSIDLISLLIHGDLLLVLIMLALFLILGATPLIMTFKFTRASPNQLLGPQTITFPHFKRVITFLQLGISIFLIVASIVVKRQVNYSLLKEPGRNHDQVVYLKYPADLTDYGLRSLRATWKKINPNVVDLMATSQMPDKISSKELNSEFYFMSVDPGFREFFDLKIVDGNWFKANDGDSIFVVNERGKQLPGDKTSNLIGVISDLNGQFNQPEKPVKINIAPYFNYNFLCIRILEVDIRRTVTFLSNYFKQGTQGATISFMNKHFEEWLTYQDRLNSLSEILAIISAVLSCCAIYGLSVSLVRDKLKQIAIHKMCGATTIHITRLLALEFAKQMLIAVLIFGPFTYIVIKELLRSFVYTTHFTWSDPVFPLAYCAGVIGVLCGFHAFSLNRTDLSSALKG